MRAFEPPEGPPGTILCNPPYGERIGEETELRALYQALGEVLRTRCGGWNVLVFTGNPRLAPLLGLPIAEEVPFLNGAIRCRLLSYKLP